MTDIPYSQSRHGISFAGFLPITIWLKRLETGWIKGEFLSLEGNCGVILRSAVDLVDEICIKFM